MVTTSTRITILLFLLLAANRIPTRAARPAAPSNYARVVHEAGNWEVQIGAADVRIVVNGRELTPDVPPVLTGGTVLVPLRVVADALGTQVSWNPGAQEATIRGADRLVSARVGDPEVRAGDRTYTAATAPRVLRGRMMLPLRAVGQALGASVVWDARTRSVVIRTPGPVRAATTPSPRPAAGREHATGGPMQVTLRTGKQEFRAGEPVPLTLEARNTGETPLTLQFPTSQKYDFEVLRGSTVVWKWSDDRMFAQSFVEVTVGPNQALTFSETWTQRDRQGQPIAPGEYTVAGTLTTRSVNVSPTRATIRILPKE